MTPDITVVVVVGPVRERAADCLASLRAQGLGPRLEVLLVDVAPEGTPPVEGSDDPSVRVVRLPEDSTFAGARAGALPHVRSAVVAFAEEHTRLAAGWAEAVLAAYREGPWSGVGWAVAVAQPAVRKADVIGLMSYGLFEPPVAAGEAAFLPGHNASYRTEVLRAYGAELPELLRCDLALQERMRREGHRLGLAAGAVMEHRNETHARSICRGIYLYYRLYGPARAAEGRWSLARRALYVLATPAIPVYYVVNAFRRMRQDRPERARLLLRHLPTVLAVQLCGAVGQAAGLLFGVGDAEARFSRYELTEPR